MSKKCCFHYYVSGKVQGVWFRAHTQTQAQQLGLTGWVRNLPDGRVEVLVCGDEEKLDKLDEWLKRGPDLAKVSELARNELPWQVFTDFDIT